MHSIDVCIPCYRYARYLPQCVHSVLSQGHPGTRVLVIDDASPDDTEAVGRALARQDARVEYRRHAHNMGHIATFNEGVAWARGEAFLLLSADDYLLPGALLRATRLMDQHPAIGLVYGLALELGDGDAPPLQSPPVEPVAYRHWRGAQFIAHCGAANPVPAATAVVRTSVQQRVGSYRPELPHSGDFEMWLRCAAVADVACIEEPQAVYRRHAANMSSAYYVDSRLPDLQHRLAAIDSLVTRCAPLFDRPVALRRRMVGLLGREAIGLASEAFNRGDRAACARLNGFALQLQPRLRLSTPHLRLLLKRAVGQTAWRRVQSLRRAG
jgi:cellulose synthase/poly-beta-1,6-N-acetylglucosamine synthase-like glycosyltransferase